MSYTEELLYKVSYLYYIEDLKQESIARRLKISRYKVSRVLKKAKNEGLIKIQVIRSGYNDEYV